MRTAVPVVGVSASARAAAESAASTGSSATTEGFVDSVWGHYPPGSITGVRIWAGAMASQDQISTTIGD
jgi:hypothetical protein